ncbi:hypothetical protein Tco_1026944 [Tanacetum coccineum]
MAQQIILADKLVPNFQSIRRCNNYDVLQNIPYSLECKIVGQLLLDHPLGYALTTTADVPVIVGYQGVVDKKKDVIQYPHFIKFIIIDLMKKFDSIPQRLEEEYHSIKDDISLLSVYFTGNMIIQGILIPDAFITDEIRTTKEYKEYEQVFVGVDVPMIQQLVVSTQGTYRNTPRALRSPTLTTDIASKKKRKQVAGETSSPRKSLKVTIRQKNARTTLTPPPCDDQESNDMAEATLLSLTLHKTALAVEARENIAKVQEKLEEEEIEKMDECEDNEESYASEFADSMFQDDDNDYDNRIEPKKDDKKDAKKANDEKKKDETGSMDTRKEKMQTPIPSPTRSPRKTLSSNKTLSQELTETASPSTSKAQRKIRRISSKYNHIPGVIHRICRHQGYMIQHIEKKYVTDYEFWKVHGKVDKVLYEIIPHIAENATDDLIEGNLKRFVADTIIQECDVLQAEVPALVSKESANQAPPIIEEIFKNYVSNNVIQVHPTTSTSTSTTSSVVHQQQLYLNMNYNLQDQAADPELWDALKRKFEKSSTLTTSYRDDAFRLQHHDDHQQPTSTYVSKRQQQQQDLDAWIEPQVIDEDEEILEDTTPKLIDKFQNVDKHIPTIYNYARIMATLNDVIIFYGPQRNPNEPPRYLYNKDLFFLKYGNTEERSYILSLYKIHVVPFPKDDLEEKLKR